MKNEGMGELIPSYSFHMGKEATFLHKCTVRGGKIYPERPDWYYSELTGLEGKEIYVYFEEAKIDKSPAQLAVYFGVIIKKYLMSHPDFAGWTWREIDSYIRLNVASYPKTFVKGGLEVTIIVQEEIRDFSKSRMTTFLEDLFRFLAETHDIYIEDPYQFKLNKYIKKDESISGDK